MIKQKIKLCAKAIIVLSDLPWPHVSSGTRDPLLLNIFRKKTHTHTHSHYLFIIHQLFILPHAFFS